MSMHPVGALRWLSAAGWLHLVERAWLAAGWASQRPQLFITGLPRSGTTLVYQYVVHRLSVAYFTNGVGRFPFSPCVVTLLQAKWHRDYCSDFRSRYGRVEGAMAPREAGGFWARVFALDDYQVDEDVDPARLELLHRTVHLVQHIFGDRPFVNKNVKHLLRIDALAKAFPEARFLIVERRLEDAALSLLRARHASGDPEAWLSARPPDYARLAALPVERQVAGQLVSLRRRLEADLAALEPRRVLRVRYEDFCSEPESLIAPVREAIGETPFKSPPEKSFAYERNRARTPSEERLVAEVRDAIDR